jgi:hypothetical protein
VSVQPVDVLDWIRLATTGLNCLCEGSPAAKRGIEVHAAVAELIDVLREFVKDAEANGCLRADYPLVARGFAALARIGGTP